MSGKQLCIISLKNWLQNFEVIFYIASTYCANLKNMRRLSMHKNSSFIKHEDYFLPTWHLRSQIITCTAIMGAGIQRIQKCICYKYYTYLGKVDF